MDAPPVFSTFTNRFQASHLSEYDELQAPGFGPSSHQTRIVKKQRAQPAKLN